MKSQRKTSCIPHIRNAFRITILTCIFGIMIQPMSIGQADTAYSFIVAGHAYGAHGGSNLGLHPAFLNSLNSGFDTNTLFFIFTGDIVNQSTPESWQQVENELSVYSLPYYYVMGNHDANETGQLEFESKFGGLYYAFNLHSELYIILNSTEEERSISSNQIDFLEEQLNHTGDSIRNIFIFFHEVLWNSHEKYVGVKSNSRSRFDQIVNYSDYWEEVHPLLLALPEKKFYVIAGDVGGNPDAIAAFYDEWDNVTLVASGMGEVIEENYLLVHVSSEDSVDFELVPLNSDLTLPDIEYYSVPLSPATINGPELITPGSSNINYTVPEVFNADSYIWDIPDRATGLSSSNSIVLDFDADFTDDTLFVRAAREGFGSGPASWKIIESSISSIEYHIDHREELQLNLIQTGKNLILKIHGIKEEPLLVRLFDCSGRCLKMGRIDIVAGYSEMHIDNHEIPKGMIFVSVFSPDKFVTEKFVIR